jgi:hypothetical protein
MRIEPRTRRVKAGVRGSEPVPEERLVRDGVPRKVIDQGVDLALLTVIVRLRPLEHFVIVPVAIFIAIIKVVAGTHVEGRIVVLGTPKIGNALPEPAGPTAMGIVEGDLGPFEKLQAMGTELHEDL